MAKMRMLLEVRYAGKEGTELEFVEETLVLGRTKGNVRINDPLVSGEHLRLFEKDSEIWVEDLKSSNGTMLNEEDLKPGEPRLLNPGDEISIGGITTVILRSAGEPDEVDSEEKGGSKDTIPPSMTVKEDGDSAEKDVGPTPEEVAAAEGVWVEGESVPPRESPRVPEEIEGSFRGAYSVLMDAFNLYRSSFVLFLLVTAFLYVPAALVSGCTDSVLLSSIRKREADAERLKELAIRIQQSGAEGGDDQMVKQFAQLQAQAIQSTGDMVTKLVSMMLGAFASMIIALFLYGIAQPLTQGAVLFATAARKKGRSITWSGAWKMLLPRIVPLILTSLLTGLLTGIGMAILIIPGIIIGFFCAFVTPVILFEDLQYFSAIRRSVMLVLGDWLRVLTVSAVFVIAGVVSYLLVGAVFSTYSFFYEFFSTVIQVFLIPVPFIAGALLYFDIRLKEDGEECMEEAV